MSDYRETAYTCPSCGSAIRLTEFGEALPKSPPLLICPCCGLTTYRTNPDEQYTLQNYCRYREETRAVISRRTAEQEGEP